MYLWGTFLVNITSENRWYDPDGFAADGDMARVPVPIGRSPQANAGFRKLGEKGSLTANQKVFPTEKCRGLPGKFPFDSTLKSCICWEPSGLKKPENSEAPFRNPFQCGGMGGRGDFGMRLGKSRNQGHALGLEEGLSEAKPSCPLPIPAFSVFPDFVVFPASWSGADASHIPALNTSSKHLRFTVFGRFANRTAPHNYRFNSLFVLHMLYAGYDAPFRFPALRDTRCTPS